MLTATKMVITVISIMLKSALLLPSSLSSSLLSSFDCSFMIVIFTTTKTYENLNEVVLDHQEFI